MLKILFVGCVESSFQLLSTLINNNKTIVGVITKEQSQFNSDFMDLAPLCVRENIPCKYVINVNDDDSIDFIKSLSPDICYCFGWSQLLKEELITLFPKGVVGFHPAELPYNRGRHPLIWALALGLKETASSFFMITAGADEGDIISQEKVEILYEDDARTLYDKVMIIAKRQIVEFTEEFEQGIVRFIPQKLDEGNIWRKRDKRDGKIDWRMSSKAIYNLVRSLTHPYVGASFVFNETDYSVWKVQELGIQGFENIEPGKVIKVNPDGSIDVKAYDGIIRLIDFDKPRINEGDYLL